MSSRLTDQPARASITVECRLFARYAELLGRTQVSMQLPATATVADAVAALRSGFERGDLIPVTPLAAVNCEHAPPDRPLRDGDELALLPPLAGG